MFVLECGCVEWFFVEWLGSHSDLPLCIRRMRMRSIGYIYVCMTMCVCWCKYLCVSVCVGLCVRVYTGVICVYVCGVVLGRTAVQPV